MRTPRALLSTIATLFVALPACADDRPNVLFILSDDQRADTIAALGNPTIETPSLDRLVARGTTFTHAYCMGSDSGAVCLPSRAMMMTGQSFFSHDSWSKAIKRDGGPLIPEAFRNAGYATFATGKWHCGRAWFERSFEEGRSVFFGGMGSHTELQVEDLGPAPRERHPIDAYSSEAFVNEALGYIDRWSDGDRDRPFFVHVSFTAPHDPRTIPAGWETRYDPTSIPLPADFLPVHPFDNGEMRIRDEKLAPWPREEDEIRAHIAAYYAMISHLDAQVGRLLDRLDALGVTDDTIIVFASDHGLAIGSHGLLGKQNLYEHSMRAPMIFAGPNIDAGVERDGFAYLYDIGPTLCTLADVEIPLGADGTNLFDPFWKRAVVMTAYKDHMRALRDRQWKLIRYPRLNRSQLFNLRVDPHETNDLAGDPTYALKVADMEKLLRVLQRAAGDDLLLSVVEPKDGVFRPER